MVSLSLANIPTSQGLDGAVLLSTPPQPSSPFSCLASSNMLKALTQHRRRKRKRHTHTHTGSFCAVFFFPSCWRLLKRETVQYSAVGFDQTFIPGSPSTLALAQQMSFTAHAARLSQTLRLFGDQKKHQHQSVFHQGHLPNTPPAHHMNCCCDSQITHGCGQCSCINSAENVSSFGFQQQQQRETQRGNCLIVEQTSTNLVCG